MFLIRTFTATELIPFCILLEATLIPTLLLLTEETKQNNVMQGFIFLFYFFFY